MVPLNINTRNLLRDWQHRYIFPLHFSGFFQVIRVIKIDAAERIDLPCCANRNMFNLNTHVQQCHQNLELFKLTMFHTIRYLFDIHFNILLIMSYFFTHFPTNFLNI